MLNKAVFTRTINKPEADKLQILSNPNLLDNGNFQVSQRGTNFTVSRQRVYTFDRWIVGSDDGAVTVERSDGLLVTCTEVGGALISQVISMEETNLRGQTITLAVDCEYTPGIPFSLCLYSNEGNGFHLLDAVNLTVGNTLTLEVPENALTIVYELSTPPGQFLPGQFIRLKYAKLETGPCFTGFLPISYAEDLRRCQRYQLCLTGANAVTCLGIALTDARLFVQIPTPTTIRTKPAISFKSIGVYGVNSSISTAKNITGIRYIEMSANCVRAELVSSEMTVGNTYAVVNKSANSFILLDANL